MRTEGVVRFAIFSRSTSASSGRFSATRRSSRFCISCLCFVSAWAPAWVSACLSSSPPPCGWVRIRSAISFGVVPSAKSSGRACPEASDCTSARMGSPGTSAGLKIAVRHAFAPSITPGLVSIGSTPARASDDFPLPLEPRMRVKCFGGESAEPFASISCA